MYNSAVELHFWNHGNKSIARRGSVSESAIKKVHRKSALRSLMIASVQTEHVCSRLYFGNDIRENQFSRPESTVFRMQRDTHPGNVNKTTGGKGIGNYVI